MVWRGVGMLWQQNQNTTHNNNTNQGCTRARQRTTNTSHTCIHLCCLHAAIQSTLCALPVPVPVPVPVHMHMHAHVNSIHPQVLRPLHAD